jgi:hypothetical protein
VENGGIKASRQRRDALNTHGDGELPQELHIDVRHKEGRKEAARLIEELLAHGGKPLQPLRLCSPLPGDEQAPLTDKDLPLLLEWIDRWVDTLPGNLIKLDFSGNRITAHGVTLLGACLRKHPRVQELDLSNNSFGPPPAHRKNTLTKSKTFASAVGKMTSPRGPKKMPSIGQAIAELLAVCPLQGLWLNGNPFAQADRESIVLAVNKSLRLRALGMAGCALSEREIRRLVRMNRRKHWRDLAVTPPTKLTTDCLADWLLLGNRTLVTLDLGTLQRYSTLDVTALFRALNHSECLVVLGLAGHTLTGVSADVTGALRKNTTLRRLDLSRCAFPTPFMKALVAALCREGEGPPNETLTELTLPIFNDKTFERDEKEALSRLCAIAIERNCTLARLRTQAAEALYAGFRSADAPLNTLSPALCRQIVGQIRDIPSLHTLPLVRCKPPQPEDLPITLPPLPPVPSRPPLRGSSSGKP